MTEPPGHALRFLEAFRRFSEPYAAELVGDRPASRWNSNAKDARSKATNPFFERLHRGEILCWGRRGGLCEPWQEIASAAWEYLWVWNWQSGVVAELGSRPVQVERLSPASYFSRRDGRPWIERSQGIRTSKEPYVKEQWFDCRAALADGNAQMKPISETRLANWLRANPTVNETKGWAAARRELQCRIPRSRFRAMRNKLGIGLPPGRK
jgi:hypothetical protein